MVRLPVISGDDFVKAVARVGFIRDRTEGSFMILVVQRAGVSPRPDTGNWVEAC